MAETVRRQLRRALSRRTPAREEEVIRTRFAVYATLGAVRVETMRPPNVVADEIVQWLGQAPTRAAGRVVAADSGAGPA